MDDPKSTFRIVGGRRHDYYDGAYLETGLVEIAESCPGAPAGAGPGLATRDVMSGEPHCLLIDRVQGGVLELVNPGRGNILRYRREG